jgi:predicted PurR-regulated permease PerM
LRANRYYYLTLLFLLTVLGYLTYKIMSPFFTAIAWAVVFSIIFYPFYAFVSRKVRIKSIASLITVLLILIIIVGPFTYVAVLLVKEIQSVSARLNENNLGSLPEFIEKIRVYPIFAKISSFTGVGELTSQDAITTNLQKIGNILLAEFSLGVTNALSAVIDFILILFTTFFLFRDGPGFLSKVKDLMPFSAGQKKKLAGQIKDLIVSTVYGGVVIAIIQGILGGIAYYVIGMESPVLWGITMSITSFVPLFGTFLLWGPSAAYLIIQGHTFAGIGLFLYGVFVISMVDNILKPIIIGSRTKLPTIIILFSVLGGIKFFGIIGLIMGPLITAVFISVFEIISHLEGEVEGP